MIAVEQDGEAATERQRLAVKLARAERDLTAMFRRMELRGDDTGRAVMRRHIAKQYHKIGGLHAQIASEESAGR